jgi:hypothetical protein
MIEFRDPLMHMYIVYLCVDQKSESTYFKKVIFIVLITLVIYIFLNVNENSWVDKFF